MITMTFEGDQALIAAYQSLGALAPQVVGQGLRESGEDIMAVSKETYVPVDSGALRASGFVEGPEMTGQEAVVTVGFGGPAAPYALVTHENPRAGKTGGVSPSGKKYRHWAQTGEWKYLETPLKSAGPQIIEHLTERLEAAVTEMGHG